MVHLEAVLAFVRTVIHLVVEYPEFGMSDLPLTDVDDSTRKAILSSVISNHQSGHNSLGVYLEQPVEDCCSEERCFLCFH